MSERSQQGVLAADERLCGACGRPIPPGGSIYCGTEHRPEQTFGSTFYERNPAARAFKGRLIEMRSQEQLLRNAFWVLRDMRKWRGCHLWTLVGAITGHGSGYSQQICEELGWDYEMKITPAARLPDRKAS